MRGITLTQPWATLIAIDAKRVETRGWRGFPYRGQVAIHAGKGLGPLTGMIDDLKGPAALQAICDSDPFAEALVPAAPAGSVRASRAHGVDVDWNAVLPRAAVVAVAHVRGVETTDFVGEQIRAGRVEGYGTVAQHEHAFGGYEPGRLAIFLEHITALPEPVPCMGALGLWEVPVDVEHDVRHQLERAFEQQQGAAA